jgi:hypothetical protein
VISSLQGIDGAGTLVRIKPGATLYVIGETESDGFIRVNCILCAKHLRVFGADLLEHTRPAALPATDAAAGLNAQSDVSCSPDL